MLDILQARLDERFAALAARRGPKSYPVYAIEHGLDREEVLALRAAASRRLGQFGPEHAYWLIWVVLAAEAGYAYDGEEFWPTLEHRRGEWASNVDRSRIRQWNQQFVAKYRGPTPVGRWAKHFSIIAWPIANSVLPRYLQNHFAQHLYNLRHELAEAANGSLDELGRLLRDGLPEHGSRFADFLQQTDLTARIVLALRDEDLDEDVARLEPATLHRFVADLEQRRGAKVLLQEARRVLREGRWRMDHRLQPSTGRAAPAAPAAATSRRTARLSLGAAISEGALSLGLVMPSLETTLTSAGVPASELSSCRIALDPGGRRWSPALALMGFAGQIRPLARFPDPGAPVFPIDGPAGRCREALTDLLRLEEKPVWLLRRRGDGLYREVHGRLVSADETYILLCRSKPPSEALSTLEADELTSAVFGVVAYGFGPLGRVMPLHKTALEALGLGYRLRARLSPAGLNPRPFDVPTWTVGEPVVLRVSADFDVAEFQFELSSGARLRAQGRHSGVFLELQEQPVGRHWLTAHAIPAGTLPQAVEPATLEFEVRPARPWPETVSDTAAVRLLVLPHGAGLEALFSQKAQIFVQAPPNRRLTWSVSFVDAHGLATEPASIGEGADDAAIVRILDRLRDAHSDAIDDAHRVDLIVAAEGQGRQVLRFPHKVEPLRWRFDRTAGRARLIDESGHDAPLDVFRLELTAPARAVGLEPVAAASGIEVRTPGAVFCARYGERLYPTFCSAPARTLASLEDLAPRQDFHDVDGTPAEQLAALLQAHRVWRAARPVGPMATVRKTMTVAGLESAAAAKLCGADWLIQLRRARSSAELEPAQQAVCARPSGFGYMMRTEAWPAALDAASTDRFIELAGRYRISRDPKLCRAALAAAWALGDLPCEGPGSAELLGRLLDAQDLVRGAFLANAVAGLGELALRRTA